MRRRFFGRKLNKYGVSEVVSAIITVMIVLSSVALALTWGLPYIEERKLKSQLQTSYSNFDIMSNIISNLIVDGPDTRGVCDITSTNDQGSLTIDSKGDKLILMYSYNKTYDFNVSGLDDEDNEFNVHMSGVTNQVPTDWYSPDWLYRNKITIPASKVGEDFKNFPVPIHVNSLYECQEDGDDILFTNATGVKLNHEIEYYTKDFGVLSVWVNVPALSSTKDTILYMYYGNPSCDSQQNVVGTWNNNFIMVQHLEEISGTRYDSTLNDNDGTASAPLGLFAFQGKFDGATLLNSSKNDYIKINYADELNGGGKDFTVETWFKSNDVSKIQHIISKCKDGSNKDYYLEINSSKLRVAYEDATNGWDDTASNGLGKTTLAANTWYYGAFTFNHTSRKLTLHLNGSEEGSWILPSDLPDTIEPLSIGRRGGNHNDLYFNGTLDEIRVLNTEKNSKWIQTSYNTASYDFYEIGMTERRDGAPILSRIETYNIDPSKAAQRFSPKITHYGMVYRLNWCSQSFIPNYNGKDNLTKVYLYLGKKGSITDSLTVSIYNNLNTKLGSRSISADSVSTDISWIPCDFSSGHIELTGGIPYYLVLNTSGGSYGTDDGFNYYTWLINESNCSSGNALSSSNGGVSWGYPSGNDEYDFYQRIIYKNHKPPYTPEIDGILYGNPTYWFTYTGILNSCTVFKNSSDPYANNLFYRSDWGDGTDTGWLGPYDSHLSCPIYHRWTKPGIYRWVVQVKGEYGNENEKDNVTIINVIRGLVVPEDRIDDEPLQGVIKGNSVLFSQSLNGTRVIDLYASDFSDLVPCGRIWVFPLGSVTYNAPYTIGVQKVIFENNVMISDGPTYRSLKKEPIFFETEDALAFRIIQVKAASSAGGGGTGTYRLALTMRSSANREFSLFTNILGSNPGGKIYNFKLQVYGDNKDVWLDYFTNTYNFTKLSSRPDTLLYKEYGKLFILDSSLVEISVEGIR